MTDAHTFCSHCGTRYETSDWPRKCQNMACGNLQFNNPTPIGVLLQTVTDGKRIGVLTPVRGHAPMIGHPAGTGGFQEVTDRSFEDTGSRETDEEIKCGRPNVSHLELFHSRTCGPLRPVGKRQVLAFSVNRNPMRIEQFDGFVPDDETLSIEFSWKPRVLAFPTHTEALALYFQRFQGITPPAYYMDQPHTGDDVLSGNNVFTIYDIPYDQPALDDGLWSVMLGTHKDNWTVKVRRDKTGHWESI